MSAKKKKTLKISFNSYFGGEKTTLQVLPTPQKRKIIKQNLRNLEYNQSNQHHNKKEQKFTKGLGKTFELDSAMCSTAEWLARFLSCVGLSVSRKLLNHTSWVVISSREAFYSSKSVRQLWPRIFTVMLCTLKTLLQGVPSSTSGESLYLKTSHTHTHTLRSHTHKGNPKLSCYGMK